MASPRLLYPALVAAAILLGLGLRWPVLTDVGLGSDDYVHHAMLHGVYPVPRSALDLFNFADGTEDEARALRDFGALPWWHHPEFRLAMLRPLSSALIGLDHALFGKNPVAFHLHSMIWWALLVAAVALLLREILPAGAAAVAVILFAVEEGHGVPLLWLANRNSLVSLGLGTLGLWCHLRFRRTGRFAYLALSAALLSLALLGGEWAFTILGYLFAYEALAVDRSRASRFFSLLPAILLGLAFLLAQNLLGYGTQSSNLYTDPVSEPLVYLSRAARRIPVLFADMFFGLPALWWQTGSPWTDRILALDLIPPQVWIRLPGWRFWHLLFGSAAVAVSVLAVLAAFRRYPRHAFHLRWLLTGALLSLLPIASSIPASRSVVPAFIGFSVLFSLLLLDAFRGLFAALGLRRRPTADNRQPTTDNLTPRLALRSSLLVILLVAGSQISLATVRSIREIPVHANFYRAVRNWVLNAETDDATIAGQHLFQVNGIEHTSVIFPSFVRYFHGRPLPRSCRILSAAPAAHDIARPAPDTLDFTVLGGTFLEDDLETFYRADRFPFRAGQTVRLDGLTVTILRLYRNKPLTVRFTFDRPLEDPSYLFLHATPLGIRRFPLPAVGEKVRLPRASFPF